MRRCRLLTLLLALAAAPVAVAEPLLALCYHDVVRTEAEALADPTAVTVDALVRQLSWLHAEGYQPVTLDQWTTARQRDELPERAVLLTFDDGYASFHHHVQPLLELFGFPAVLAPVTSWIEVPPGGSVAYGDETVARERFMTWKQIREARDSGLVEIASHSHDLHRGVIGNPFGNLQPAAITRGYQPDSGRYETDARYEARLRADLAASAELIEQRVGARPRTVAWPYGAHNAQAVEAARSLGFSRFLTLDERPNTPGAPVVHRVLVGSDMDLDQFAMTVRGLYPPTPLRAAHIDLDYVYDPDPAQMGRNLDRLLDRIKAMRINRVLLQAFADPDGDGVAEALYFPNRHLPMREDLFDRVAWQLKTRAGVQVLAWMPVLAFQLPDAELRRELAVSAADGSHRHRYYRLSPFHPSARRIVSEIYDDLGRTSYFAGVLFHDDAFLTDREDASPAALAHYRQHAGIAVGDPVDWRGLTTAETDALARLKTQALIDFTHELADVLRRHQPALVTARNLYARVVTDPESERWFAQSLALFLTSYDYTAVMAMPLLEQAQNPVDWLTALAARIAREPRGMERTLFEVQTVDWRTGTRLDARTLARHLDALLDAGAHHIAWYPDDFVGGHPDLRLLRSRLSLSHHPAMLE